VIAFSFVCSILIVTFKINNPVLFIYFGILGAVFLWFMVKIYQADRKTHFTQLSAIAKILMLVGTLSMGFL
jgi:4-hydroxybenzoate polyprenyltransferase